eukprot:g698.t1
MSGEAPSGAPTPVTHSAGDTRVATPPPPPVSTGQGSRAVPEADEGAGDGGNARDLQRVDSDKRHRTAMDVFPVAANGTLASSSPTTESAAATSIGDTAATGDEAGVTHEQQRKNLRRHAHKQRQIELKGDGGPETLTSIETAYGGYRKKLAREARRIARSPDKVRRFSDDGQGNDSKDPVLGQIASRGTDDRRLGKRVVELLLCLGLCAALLNFAIEKFVERFYEWKTEMMKDLLADDASPAAHFFTYFAWILVTMLGACAWVVHFGPQARGSGIPEMKTMMAGDGLSDNEHGWAKGYLDFRTGVSKVGGLATALASGAFIGREGPFVHLSCIVGKQIMRLPYFGEVNKSRTLRPQILGAACAVGVSTSFFAPIGGVLFSIEVTATYYLVSSYWKSFVSAMAGAVAVRIVEMAGAGWDFNQALAHPFFQPHKLDEHKITADNYQLHGLLAAVAVGAMCGLWTFFFVRGADKLMAWKGRHFGPTPQWLRKVGRAKDARDLLARWHKMSWYRRNIAPYCGVTVPVGGKDDQGKRKQEFFDISYIFLVCLLTALIRFPGGSGAGVELSPKKLMGDLFAANKTLPDGWGAWGGVSGATSMPSDDAVSRFNHDAPALVFFMFAYVLLADFSILLPVPAGVFIPSFALGAVLGRFVALVFDLVPFLRHEGLDAGAFAVVGAGAMAGGVTRTISASVLTLEMTGRFDHALPSFIAVFVAMWVSEQLKTPSIYDLILGKKKLPYLQVLDFRSRTLTASDVMQPTHPNMMLNRNSTFGDAIRILSTQTSNSPIPVVDTELNPLFFGTLMKSVLREQVEAAFIKAGLGACLANEKWSKGFEPEPGWGPGSADSEQALAHNERNTVSGTPAADARVSVMSFRRRMGWQSPRKDGGSSASSSPRTPRGEYDKSGDAHRVRITSAPVSSSTSGPTPPTISYAAAARGEAGGSPQDVHTPLPQTDKKSKKSRTLRAAALQFAAEKSEAGAPASHTIGGLGRALSLKSVSSAKKKTRRTSGIFGSASGSKIVRSQSFQEDGDGLLDPHSAEAVARKSELEARSLGLFGGDDVDRKRSASKEGETEFGFGDPITSYIQPAAFTVQQV